MPGPRPQSRRRRRKGPSPRLLVPVPVRRRGFGSDIRITIGAGAGGPRRGSGRPITLLLGLPGPLAVCGGRAQFRPQLPRRRRRRPLLPPPSHAPSPRAASLGPGPDQGPVQRPGPGPSSPVARLLCSGPLRSARRPGPQPPAPRTALSSVTEAPQQPGRRRPRTGSRARLGPGDWPGGPGRHSCWPWQWSGIVIWAASHGTGSGPR